jgi:serine/threonine protein kinase
MPLSAGDRLGPHEILARLGAGGMGEVWKARDSRLDRIVALKIPKDGFDERFEREARAIASLNHPNICILYDVGPDFLVMEYVEGPTLTEHLAARALPLQEALLIARQLAEAIEAAHEQGIVHRDLKPANIKLTSGGNVKVLDFGLAKAAQKPPAPEDSGVSTVTLQQTRPGVILGTAGYMSPEQARGAVVDKRADIWAFGCVVFEMLAGRRPFQGVTFSDRITAVLEREPDWQALPETTPAVIRRLLQRCLEKDPKRRLHDIADARIEIEDALTAPAVSPQPAASHWNVSVAWSLAVAGFLGTFVLGLLFFRRSPPEPAELRLDIVTPPTNDPVSMAVSPDGRMVVFAGAAEGSRQQLWLRSLDSATSQPLSGTEGAIRPFWSPDSRSIGFFDAGKLKRIDLAGGTVVTLADAPEVNVSSGTWNRQGVIVFSSGRGFNRIPAAGGEVVALPRPAAPPAGRWTPQFLPDGRHLLFFGGGPPDVRGVYLGSLDAPEVRRLFEADTTAIPAPPSHLLYVHQGTLFAQRFNFDKLEIEGAALPVTRRVASSLTLPGVSASATGTVAYRSATEASNREFAWFDRSGRRLGAVLEAERLAGNNPEISPDGRRLAFERTINGNTDCWLLEFSGGLLTRFTFDPAFDGYPVWSPDGQRLVFMSQRDGGVMNLYQKISSGAGTDEPLLLTPSQKMPTDWSPDGGFVIYRDLNLKGATGRDLLVVPLAGDRKPFPYANTKAEEREAQFSPDGRWIAYQSNESGRFEVYVQAFPEPRGKWQVSNEGGTQPRWRRDGRELFYIGLDSKLMAAPIIATGGSPQAGRPAPLFPIRIAGGALQGLPKQQYAVAPDGRFLINVETGETNSFPITLILHWKAPEKP